MALTCICGNILRVAAAHTGRKVACPRCGASVVVPTVADFTDRGDRTAPAMPGRSSMVPGILAAFVALALAAAAIGLWTRPRPETRIDPLDFLALDAEAIAVVRVSDLWATIPRGKGDDPAAPLERATGMRPDEIERVWFVWHRPSENVGWAVIRTSRPYSPDKILSRFRDQETLLVGRHRLLSGTTIATGGRAAVCFLDSVTILAGTEGGVRKALSLRPEDVERASLAQWDQDAAQHYGVLKVNSGASWFTLIGGLGLLDGADATVDVEGRRIRFQASLVANRRFAILEILRPVIQTQVLLEAERLRPLEIRGDTVGAAAGTLAGLLENVKFRSGKRSVLVETEGDTGEVLRALAVLPELLQR